MIQNFELASTYTKALFEDDPDMLDIKEYAIKNSVPILTDEVLAHILFLIKKMRGKALEIGTAIGYSGLYISKYLELTSIEIDEKRYEIAKENFEKRNVKANLILGDALEKLKDIKDSFSFIFIDASKGQYEKFFDLCYPLLEEDGLIYIDNLLFRSLVCESEYPRKYRTICKNLNNFINRLNKDYDFVLLPFADGVGIIRKGKK